MVGAGVLRYPAWLIPVVHGEPLGSWKSHLGGLGRAHVVRHPLEALERVPPCKVEAAVFANS